MSELGEHHCSACGEIHGGSPRRDPAVEIARIQCERDIEIARMEYREAQQLAAVEAETAVVVTELETESAVAVAEATDPPLLPPEPEPTVMSAPGPVDDGLPEDAPPETEGSPPPESKRKIGLGAW